MEVFNPDALRVAMGRRMITAPELALKLGKKSSKVKRYLLGINEPSKEELKQIAKILNWPVGYFYKVDVVFPKEIWISGQIVSTRD